MKTLVAALIGITLLYLGFTASIIWFAAESTTWINKAMMLTMMTVIYLFIATVFVRDIIVAWRATKSRQVIPYLPDRIMQTASDTNVTPIGQATIVPFPVCPPLPVAYPDNSA